MSVRTAHRGAGPRYMARPVRRSAIVLARIDQGEGSARYVIGPRFDARRALVGMVTLVMLVVALVSLATLATEQRRDDCREIMRGSDFLAGAAYCREAFGPRGY